MKVKDLWGVIVNVHRSHDVRILGDDGKEVEIRAIEKHQGYLLIKPAIKQLEMDLK